MVEKNFSTVILRARILSDARALGIPEGFAVNISESVARVVDAFLGSHPVVTKRDLDSLVSDEIKKFHPDLAYIYENRDKII